MKKMPTLPTYKVSLFLLTLALVVGGIAAQASGILNTPTGGYLLCVNSKTKVITHPGTTSCPKGSKKLTVGAAGKDGKTLWNGEKDPENTLGSPGDLFVNSVTKTLFGPKNLDGTWPAGVSLIGPKGDQGPGGSGPAGPAGPAGSNATLTCAQGGTCVVGNTGPGGGIVFYVQTATAAAPWRYMEAAPNTWSGDTGQGGVAIDPQVKFCNVVNAYVNSLRNGTPGGATSYDFGTGFRNTRAMLGTCSYGAANLAATYSGGGKSDWFLGSKDEMAELFSARGVVGGWPPVEEEAAYWTSSEHDLDRAIVIYMSGSELDAAIETKAAVNRYVRPIRAF
jgi:hypothetical protein